MIDHDFTKTFINYIQPGNHILDLGAGEGMFAQMFVDQGAHVTAVDSHLPPFSDRMVSAKRMRVEEFCRADHTNEFDLIFARNILQFLDKQWVFDIFFPWMNAHTHPKSIIAIKTFYQDPEPRFQHLMRSLYHLKELSDYFISWNELQAREYVEQGSDMVGCPRIFFITSLILQKNPEFMK